MEPEQFAALMAELPGAAQATATLIVILGAEPIEAEQPAGIWLGASRARGETVYTDQPYPHIHGRTLPSGAEVWRNACAACPPRGA